MLPDPTKGFPGWRASAAKSSTEGSILMQKKLLAVAVAGALAAPAVALAQSSVTVSGNINFWYETAGATGATTTCPVAGCAVSTFDVKNRDRMQDGNGSNIRFTAVEDLGTGMQAFAQVESAVGNQLNQ